MTESQAIVVEPIVGALDADLVLPGSKSITNRALITAALAPGASTLRGVGLSNDTQAMIDALSKLGVECEIAQDQTTVTVRGLGSDLVVPSEPLDANMSGTSARFLLPVLARVGSGTLTAHQQMRGRPMGTLVTALRELGAVVSSETLPIVVESGVTGNSVEIDATVSSQFISALLLTAPTFDEGLNLTLAGALVSTPYVDMTIEVMRSFGAVVNTADNVIVVEPGGYTSTDYDVEPDASTATYPLAAAAIVGGRVRVVGLGTNSLQGDAAFASSVLSPMGADVVLGDDFIEVRGSGVLDAVDVDLGTMSDTAPTFAALAAKAVGASSVTGIGFIRTTKESDRVQGSVDELNRVGVRATMDDDGFTVIGGPHQNEPVETYEDHRMAMAFALLGLRGGPVTITDPDCVGKTFPGFWDMLDTLRSSARPVARVLAIDGPAGSGKSTIAKNLSMRLSIPHLDTGAMYRAVTAAVIDSGVDVEDVEAVGSAARNADIVIGKRTVLVDGVDKTTRIREPDVTALVSVVAANPQVRTVLVDAQRAWANARGAAVMEGRDITSVVFPDSATKIYLDASVAERARRRADEIGETDLVLMEQKIVDRDHLDMTRETDPLMIVDDAVVIDSTSMTTEQVMEEIIAVWERQDG